MSYAIKIKSRYRSDSNSTDLLLPAIFTEAGVLISHLRYLAYYSGKSASWRDRSVFSLMLLIKYIRFNEDKFSSTMTLLRAFTNALVEGTIDSKTLEDPTLLFWSPRRLDDVQALLTHITSYTDWLILQPGHDGLRANPFRKATSLESRLNWCAYFHKREHVFLNHLPPSTKAKERFSLVRMVQSPKVSKVSKENVVRFSESSINEFMGYGWVRARKSIAEPSHRSTDYKGQAITLLMHYGGIRQSEAFHLYSQDVICDVVQGNAVVRIYHPSEGESPVEGYNTRSEYLAKLYQLKPRTKYHRSERLHLGWKAPSLSDTRGFFQVQFFPPDKAREFLLVWANYLKHQRVPPSKGRDHPYAFTNSSGQPETLKNFRRLHLAAVKRIGLRVGKYFGTTGHGHRHSYGYRLAENGFSQVDIQKAMHHKNPDSCLIYIQSSDSELRAKMERRCAYVKKNLLP